MSNNRFNKNPLFIKRDLHWNTRNKSVMSTTLNKTRWYGTSHFYISLVFFILISIFFQFSVVYPFSLTIWVSYFFAVFLYVHFYFQLLIFPSIFQLFFSTSLFCFILIFFPKSCSSYVRFPIHFYPFFPIPPFFHSIKMCFFYSVY